MKCVRGWKRYFLVYSWGGVRGRRMQRQQIIELLRRSRGPCQCRLHTVCGTACDVFLDFCIFILYLAMFMAAFRSRLYGDT